MDVFDWKEDSNSGQSIKSIIIGMNKKNNLQVFNDLPKIEEKTIEVLDQQLKCMTMSSENTINSKSLFKIIGFEEHEKLFVEELTLRHTQSTEVEWTYKIKYKSIGEVDDFTIRKVKSLGEFS
ncbi:hypothetical protein R3W88_012452 [Solanum pinnatisectum]|uniref:Uncharacterized protein n=1 Tax=Solanum pinnatisectum TaxID=50273 RepID=A0AAV9LA49_9SOLN|nr:hypothetical protein R3W88_012452 [Solanum pinnatisectum]